jgi:hypothetical protein
VLIEVSDARVHLVGLKAWPPQRLEIRNKPAVRLVAGYDQSVLVRQLGIEAGADPSGRSDGSPHPAFPGSDAPPKNARDPAEDQFNCSTSKPAKALSHGRWIL